MLVLVLYSLVNTFIFLYNDIFVLVKMKSDPSGVNEVARYFG